MKAILLVLLMAAVLCLFPFIAQSQSTMEFQAGTTIEVQTGADICADNVIINGTYSGNGTKCGGVLPVELVAMNALATLDAVTLNWKTATEVNNYAFEVERRAMSSDQWREIGFVPGSGTSNAPHNYSFTDQKLTAGIYAYRLRQVDNGGAFKYSQETQVTIEAPKVFALSQNYPDPFNPSTNISFSIPATSFVSLKVFDALGREVSVVLSEQMPAGKYSRQWNATGLPSGVYFYRLQAGSFIETKKLVLLR